MDNIFSGSEIVELGIRIEKNGRDFYRTLAVQSRSEPARKMFEYLAKEEEKHILVFGKIMEKTTQYEPPPIYGDEYTAYMNSLAGDYVFTQRDKGEEIAKQIKTDKEAIEKGIHFEKESILFYDGMKKFVPSYDHKIIDELIAQEKNHLIQLFELRDTPG